MAKQSIRVKKKSLCANTNFGEQEVPLQIGNWISSGKFWLGKMLDVGLRDRCVSSVVG